MQNLILTCFLTWCMLTEPASAEHLPLRGKTILSLSGGTAILTQSVGDGEGATTKGKSSALYNGRLLYGVSHRIAMGVDLSWETHSIQNVLPTPLDFGENRTQSVMAAIQYYPRVNNKVFFPYGLIGIGHNRNTFQPSDAFLNRCVPTSACTVKIDDTPAIKISVGLDAFIRPGLSVHTEIGWKLNSGRADISTADASGAIRQSNNSYNGSTASWGIGVRYFFPPKKRTKQVPSKPLPLPDPVVEEPDIVEPEKPVPAPIQSFQDILFDPDSSQISGQSRKAIQAAAIFLKSHPGIPIEVGGHASLHGSKQSNAVLSKKRAETVKKELIRLGVKNRMHVVLYGTENPANPAQSEAADRANRRVTIKRLKQ